MARRLQAHVVEHADDLGLGAVDLEHDVLKTEALWVFQLSLGLLAHVFC